MSFNTLFMRFKNNLDLVKKNFDVALAGEYITVILYVVDTFALNLLNLLMQKSFLHQIYIVIVLPYRLEPSILKIVVRSHIIAH